MTRFEFRFHDADGRTLTLDRDVAETVRAAVQSLAQKVVEQVGGHTWPTVTIREDEE